MDKNGIVERYLGALFGLAVGDALGTAVESRLPGTFSPVQDMLGGGPYNLAPGQWTDDTAMALCLAESLLECRGFNPLDQMKRYLRWFKEGYMSSTGEPFGVGQTVKEALLRFERTNEPFCGSIHRMSAGNGSLMRLAPVPLAYGFRPLEAISRSGDSSLTTHGSVIAVDACRYFGALIVGALQGASKEELLSKRFCPVADGWKQKPLVPEIDEVACGSFKEKQPPEIEGSGYVAKSLEAALWAFYHSDSFREGVLLAVNLGNDADTTGAVFGQLAGAYYGMRSIPEEWLSRLAKKDLIRSFAVRLYELACSLS